MCARSPGRWTLLAMTAVLVICAAGCSFERAPIIDRKGVVAPPTDLDAGDAAEVVISDANPTQDGADTEPPFDARSDALTDGETNVPKDATTDAPSDTGPPVLDAMPDTSRPEFCDLDENEGEPCDDGVRCTLGERCMDGECTGGIVPDCSALDGPCQTGVCDERTLRCVPQPRNDGDPCDDANECTVGERCYGGVCAAVSCAAGQSCALGCPPGCDCALGCHEAASCDATCASGMKCQVECGGADVCSLDCQTEADCQLACREAGSCEMNCAAGSSCIADCSATGDCSLDCGKNATCLLDCQDSRDCTQLRCGEGARCYVHCRDTAACSFATCDVEPIACEGGFLACNLPCP